MRNFINYGKYNNASLFLRIGENARRKMFACFMDIVKPSANDTVLDIGVTPNNGPVANNFFEKLYPYTRNITMCSIEDASCLEQDFPGAKFVRNYPGQPLPFGNKQFDVVVCWAVIEHVGDYPQQFDFLNELLRVGKRLYLTTPNKLFPIELHTALPFVHWLPRKIHQRILKILGITFYADTKNLNLLTAANLRGMLKSIICTPPPPILQDIFSQNLWAAIKYHSLFFWTNIDVLCGI